MYEFDEDTQVEQVKPELYRGTISGRWNLGTVPNGGYTLAIALHALEQALGRPDPIVATATYLRPPTEGPVEIAVEAIKKGRQYAVGQARLVQQDKERIRVVSTHGTLPTGDSGPRHVTGRPPELPPRERCLLDRPAGVHPAIAERLDMALDPDTVSFVYGERSGHAEIRGSFAFADGRAQDLRSLAVAADAFPPAVLNVLDPGWVPTLELTVHFRARPAGHRLRCRFATRFLFGGHLEEDGELWDEQDRLVAQSRQLAVLPRSAPDG
jgi:acyl-coenzyme A thioesterase PaaI-like protein